MVADKKVPVSQNCKGYDGVRSCWANGMVMML